MQLAKRNKLAILIINNNGFFFKIKKNIENIHRFYKKAILVKNLLTFNYIYIFLIK